MEKNENISSSIYLENNVFLLKNTELLFNV